MWAEINPKLFKRSVKSGSALSSEVNQSSHSRLIPRRVHFSFSVDYNTLLQLIILGYVDKRTFRLKTTSGRNSFFFPRTTFSQFLCVLINNYFNQTGGKNSTAQFRYLIHKKLEIEELRRYNLEKFRNTDAQLELLLNQVVDKIRGYKAKHPINPEAPPTSAPEINQQPTISTSELEKELSINSEEDSMPDLTISSPSAKTSTPPNSDAEMRQKAEAEADLLLKRLSEAVPEGAAEEKKVTEGGSDELRE